MKPLQTLAIILGMGVAGGAAAAPLQPPPAPAMAPAPAGAAEVDFEIRLGIPGLERHDDRTDRRLITPRRAVRIASARVPMRVRAVDRTGRFFIVRGITRRGPVSVSVHRFTGRIEDVKHARGHHGPRFGHRNRNAGHLERRRGGLDIIVRNNDDDDDDRPRRGERRRENLRDVRP